MFDRALCDLGASINLMPLSLVKRLQINEILPIDVVIRLVDKTQKQARGVVENVLLKVGKYFLPTDFVILDMEESHTHPIILGRPFLATTRALIDVERGELILRIHDEQGMQCPHSNAVAYKKKRSREISCPLCHRRNNV